MWLIMWLCVDPQPDRGAQCASGRVESPNSSVRPKPLPHFPWAAPGVSYWREPYGAYMCMYFPLMDHCPDQSAREQDEAVDSVCVCVGAERACRCGWPCGHTPMLSLSTCWTGKHGAVAVWPLPGHQVCQPLTSVNPYTALGCYCQAKWHNMQFQGIYFRYFQNSMSESLKRKLCLLIHLVSNYILICMRTVTGSILLYLDFW